MIVKRSEVVPVSLTMEAIHWTQDEVSEVGAEILGDNSEQRSASIDEILRDILVPEDQPLPSEVRDWMDPSTGDECTFSLQHAVDDEHCVDASNGVPPRALGSLLCREPPSSTGRKPIIQKQTGNSFDPTIDDDEGVERES